MSCHHDANICFVERPLKKILGSSKYMSDSGKLCYIRLFNEKVDEFFKDLILAFPEVSAFRRFKSGLSLLRNINEKTPQKIFKEGMIDKYRKAMLEKDDRVFLEGNYTMSKDYYEAYEQWDEFIDMMKKLWVTLDPDNKETIWRYFHVMIVLSDKCN